MLICSPTVTCSPKTEPKVRVIYTPKTETKVAKKFKRKSSISNQFCLSKFRVLGRTVESKVLSSNFNSTPTFSSISYLKW